MIFSVGGHQLLSLSSQLGADIQSEVMRSHGPRKGKKKPGKRILLSTLVLCALVCSLGVVFVFLNNRSTVAHQPFHYSTMQSLEIKKMIVLIQNFAEEHVIQLNASNEGSNDSYYDHILSEESADRRRYLADITVDRWTPRKILKHYYEAEIHQYNFEAELDLQIHPNHEPVFSSGFNDPYHHIRRGYGLEGSIFIAIQPSFGDSCASTVESIFLNALNPSNVFVGVLEPVGNKSHCIPSTFSSRLSQESNGFQFVDNIRVRRIQQRDRESQMIMQRTCDGFSAEEAMRFGTLGLYRGESYVLMLRDGALLRPGWDWRVKLLYLNANEGTQRNNVVLSSGGLDSNFVWCAAVKQVLSSVIPKEGHSSSYFDSLTPKKWTKDLLRSVLLDCAQCSYYLALPSRCGLAAMLPQESLEVSGTNFTNYILSSIRGNKKNPDLAGIKLGGEINLSRMVNLSIPHHVFVSVDDSVVRETRNQSDGIEGTSDLDDGFIQFLTERCSDLFEGSQKNLIKLQYELCWTEYHLPLLKKKFDSLSRSVSLGRVAAPDGSSRQMIEGLFGTFQTFFKARERSSFSLDEQRFLKKSASKLNRETSGRMASLDFLFSRAETFFSIPKHLRLEFPGDDPKLSEMEEEVPVHFDPYLPVLSEGEADLLISAKLWTSGWSFHTLTEPLVFYQRETRLRGCGNELTIGLARRQTIDRLKYIFNYSGGSLKGGFHSNEFANEANDFSVSNRFLLGTQRSLTEFVSHADLQDVIEVMSDNPPS